MITQEERREIYKMIDVARKGDGKMRKKLYQKMIAAAKEGDKDIVFYCFSDARVISDDNYKQALQAALDNNYMDIVEMLVDADANLDITPIYRTLTAAAGSAAIALVGGASLVGSAGFMFTLKGIAAAMTATTAAAVATATTVSTTAATIPTAVVLAKFFGVSGLLGTSFAAGGFTATGLVSTILSAVVPAAVAPALIAAVPMMMTGLLIGGAFLTVAGVSSVVVFGYEAYDSYRQQNRLETKLTKWKNSSLRKTFPSIPSKKDDDLRREVKMDMTTTEMRKQLNNGRGKNQQEEQKLQEKIKKLESEAILLNNELKGRDKKIKELEGSQETQKKGNSNNAVSFFDN